MRSARRKRQGKFRKRGFVYKVRIKAGSCAYNDSFLCAMSGRRQPAGAGVGNERGDEPVMVLRRTLGIWERDFERNERRNKILRELANSRKTRVKRGSNEIFEKEQKL